MEYLFSIIVPCYNQAQYLPETLQSVLDQEFHEWECIIINDGSPDNTEEVALEWTKKDNRFKYFYKKNSGVSDTRNFGVKQARGKYILPLDADDLIDKKFLREAFEVFCAQPETKLVYSNLTFFGVRNRKQEPIPYSFQKMLTENLIPVSAAFLKSDFEKVGGYNTNMVKGLEDWDFWLSFLSPDDKVVKLDGFYFHYRIKEISRSTQIQQEINEKLILQLFKNHIPLFLEYFNPIRDRIEAQYYKEQTIRLKKSAEYKIGSFFWAPVNFIKLIIWKQKNRSKNG